MAGFEVLISAFILLAVGFAVLVISRFIRVSPIIGFLIAGVFLGPYGLDLIEENKTTALLAKMGLMFLLFDIGLHFSIKSVWSRRRTLFGFAPLQMIICGGLFSVFLLAMFGVTAEMAVVLGFTLALSSTAVVVQVLADLKQTGSPVGEKAKAVLIFQDIAAIFLLILVDGIGQGEELGPLVLGTFVKGSIAFFAVMVIGYLVLTPIMKLITKFEDPEMFTVFGLLVVIALALGTGVTGLSLTLGAFLAGMVLGETPFRVLIQTELRPFRSLLLAFFFITVGMVLDPILLVDQAQVIAGLVAVIIGLKLFVIAPLAMAFKRPMHQTLELSFLLSQGSEFGFVVLGMAAVKSGIAPDFVSQLIAATAVSMMITPILMIFARKWSLHVCANIEDTISNCPKHLRNPAMNSPVFIVGMNEIGCTLARGCSYHKIPYIAIDWDRSRFLESTSAGYTVAYGDPSDFRFWDVLGVSQSRAMCIAIRRYEISKQLTPIMERLYPNLLRFVAVSDSVEAARFSEIGLIPFPDRGIPPGLEMTCAVLRELGATEENIHEWIEEERAALLDNMSATKGDGQGMELLSA